jgi:predicted ATP-binding protein involved in virulence
LNKLIEFEVQGLFGIFNHRVVLRTKKRITIIHAPNGFGKTAILRMIAGFFGGSMLVFRQYEFSTVKFSFEDGSAVRIVQSKFETPDKRRPLETRYDISLEVSGDVVVSWSPWSISAEDRGGILDRRRLGVLSIPDDETFLRDPRTGQRLDPAEAYERWEHYFPAGHKARMPEMLQSVRGLFECRLIETQRLMVRPAEKAGREAKSDFIPAVRTFSQDVAVAIKNAIQQSAAITQLLDQTFPNRLLERGGPNSFKSLAEPQLRSRLADLLKLRSRLRAAGLLSKGEEDAVLSPAKFDANTRRILTLYVFDTAQKLEVFSDLLAKIETFLGIINRRFQFKKLSLDKERGFVLTDFRGLLLEPDDLSSGEQHELVLIYELLFKTKADSLLLIDEPEISLHIAWQKHVLPDLKQIISLAPMDVILATHSPQLAGGNLDLIETLKAPE